MDTRTLEVVHDTGDNEEIVRAQRSLAKNGYVHTNDTALGLPPYLHRHIDARFFDHATLGPELAGVPPADRLRTRDVIEYRRRAGSLVLSEAPAIPMRAVADATGPRQYKRTHTLDDPLLVAWMSTLLILIPPDERLERGIIGLNFLRTFTNVVGYKHQDGECFSATYVAAREATGARTSLHPVDHPEETTFDVVLTPGEWLVFRDGDFKHDVTPLQPRFERDEPHRDAIVALVHYPPSDAPSTDSLTSQEARYEQGS